MRKGLICSVLIGSAERGNGVGRLLKAIRHEAPDVAETAQAAWRRGGWRHHRPGHEDAAHDPWRQAVGRAGSVGNRRRRRRAHGTGGIGRPCFRRLPHHGPADDEARCSERRRHRRPRQARRRQDRHDAGHRQDCPAADHRARDTGSGDRRPPLPPPSARTTSSSPRRSPRRWRRTPRSASLTSRIRARR